MAVVRTSDEASSIFSGPARKQSRLSRSCHAQKKGSRPFREVLQRGREVLQRGPSDRSLQSAPLRVRFANWSRRGSNPRPFAGKAGALTTGPKCQPIFRDHHVNYPSDDLRSPQRRSASYLFIGFSLKKYINRTYLWIFAFKI